ncbi:MarR family transcriptional regulator [Microbacterium sp. CFH 90308]|uniref:MarR family transcriptional regulator n=1 Tax=Microbacterium salsuginis TaxID=2722803 RepID=A0ABX1KE39_9MICO|nr:MarR family transcriptional regulator [Microbacterium sp. CFH 90308]
MNEALPAPTVIDLLSIAGGAVDRHVLASLRASGFEGLTVRHGYVFQRLLTSPQSVTELAQALGVSQQAMSKTVAELAGNGYLDVTADAQDGRRRTLTLTRRARAAVDAARNARGQLLSALIGRAGQEAVGETSLVLRALLLELGLTAQVEARTVRDPQGDAD